MFAITSSNAQKEDSPVYKFLKKRGYKFDQNSAKDSTLKWPNTLYYNTVYKATLLGSPTVPISFSRFNYNGGNYSLTSAISLGYGYTWFLGNFTFNENDEITIAPSFFFGADADVNVQNDFLNGKPAGSFATNIFFGFQAFALFAGYDYLSHTPSVGIVARIDVYTIFTNSLKPFGKVKELRGHKKNAKIIEA
jgi:hypothetical protein